MVKTTVPSILYRFNGYPTGLMVSDNANKKNRGLTDHGFPE
jgi:hypothetical protein